MTEAVPEPELPLPADADDAAVDAHGLEGWPQLSQLDLDVCLSETLRPDLKTTGQAPPAPPARA